MKKKFLLVIFLSAIGYITLTSYHSGAAANGGFDCTGAETGLGNPTGCMGSSCHASSATSSIGVTVELDSAGIAVTSYVPGMVYSVKISGINNGTSSLPMFGFQIGCIQGSSATAAAVNAGTWATTGLPTNTQYSAALPGSYDVNLIEQSNRISATTGTGGNGTTYVDSFSWTAPIAGTGTISFWGVLNAVNNNNTNDAGDLWNTNHVVITERPVPACIPTSSSLNQSMCSGTYTFAGHTLTTSGTYKDTLVNANAHGCDSIITLTLHIGPTAITLNPSVCYGHSYTFRNRTFSATGTYLDTITATPCDTIFTISLIVKPQITKNIFASICTGNAYSFNSQILTHSGVYKDTLPSYLGCDSITTLTLTVGPITTVVNKTICYGDTLLFHGHPHFASGVYTDTVITGLCDSIFSIHLTVSPKISTTISASVCNGSSYLYNGNHYTNPGNYTFKYASYTGCDSFVTLHLTTFQFLTSYAISGDSIVCSTPNAQYQWINCVTNQPIAGATNQAYVPTHTGVYKVAACAGGCCDTSSCYTIYFSGIGTLEMPKEISIYPNPCEDKLIVNGYSLIGNTKLEVFDLLSRQMLSVIINDSKEEKTIHVESLASGIYLLKATDTNGTVFNKKFVKK